MHRAARPFTLIQQKNAAFHFILKQGKKLRLRRMKIFITEHLTAKQANLAKTAGLLKKQGKI